ncbi:MAG: hypothetical protein Q4B67_02950 [Eubacteriales bacterium]|nr:hypothetical protein [Eubacteriales bacterium]
MIEDKRISIEKQHALKALDELNKDEFDSMLEKGYSEAVEGRGVELSASMNGIRKELNKK